jgi:hypothetical protein
LDTVAIMLLLAVRRLVVPVVLAAALPMVVTALPAAAALPATLSATGHGWGHGRGMGQWGAFGYARMGWSATQILNHFYSLTTAGAVPNQEMRVRLENMDGVDLLAQSTSGLRTSATGAAVYGAVRVKPATLGWTVESAPSCAGPWALAGSSLTLVSVNPLTDTNVASAGRDAMVQACQPDATVRWYRGSLLATTISTTRITVNISMLEAYLRSVVASEVSAGWADLGGAAALQAQAVAARSYALAENRAPGVYRTTDALLTSCCQAYGGVARRAPGGAIVPLEDVRTDAAVAAVAGVVRMFGGNPARTEYSASTGGMTVASTHSPAVVDLGDAVVTRRADGSVNPLGTNPHHTWTTSIARAAIEGIWAPSGGQLTAIDVTRRVGGGDFGGRAVEVRLTFTTGIVTVPVRASDGSGFMNRLYCVCSTGLRGDWFSFADSITGPSGGIDGTWQVASDGGIFAFGKAGFYGSTGGQRLNSPVLGMAATPTGAGYWLVAGDGGIFNYGNAAFYGSTGGIRLNRPVVGMAPTPTGKGYWLVASDGGIFAYGDAAFRGSTGGIPLNRPIVGMAPTSSGQGYWLVASDGGIFAFGDAAFRGSTGSVALAQPINGMAARPDGQGYWLLAADGGIFAFNAPFFGALPGTGEPGPAVGMVATSTGQGYLVATAAGGIVRFGDAPYLGSVKAAVPGYTGRVVGLAAHRQ